MEEVEEGGLGLETEGEPLLQKGRENGDGRERGVCVCVYVCVGGQRMTNGGN